ncbi:hypothetical protein MLD38_014918 [Melastoma candidum]|uniref:Uncharacterized protein n=1 Tax=Melastoma candidum TaxID=119954 RepID=A0ACB9RFJ5_9MYRT|nr:hypothetical protein MLD38_014918 [Melastoma candidum]
MPATAESSLSLTLYPYRLLLSRRPSISSSRHLDLSLSILLSRSLLSLPLLLPLSLLSSSSSISSTFSLLSSPASRPPRILSTVCTFPRLLATSICAHALTWLYLCVSSLLLSSLPASALTIAFVVRLLAWAGRAHLMAAMSVAAVATVASPEVEVGWGAVREGWRAVGRRWWCAWVVTVVLGLGTEGIWGGVLLKRMDGQDWSGVVGLVRWMAGIGWRAWLVVLYGFLVLLSYVVYTVFYWDYRKACYHRSDSDLWNRDDGDGGGGGGGGGGDWELQLQGSSCVLE